MVHIYVELCRDLSLPEFGLVDASCGGSGEDSEFAVLPDLVPRQKIGHQDGQT